MHNELGNHGVVKHGNLAAILHARVYAHTQQVLRVGLKHGLHWRLEAHQTACGRQEISEWIFGIDAAFNGPTVAFHIGLRDRQLFAIGHTDHHFDQVDARDSFCDGVLYLQAGIHFQEVEALVFAHHKLYCASRLVLHRFGQGDSLLAHRNARGVADER